MVEINEEWGAWGEGPVGEVLATHALGDEFYPCDPHEEPGMVACL